jgi:Flp pilus assembly pilin Flp
MGCSPVGIGSPFCGIPAIRGAVDTHTMIKTYAYLQSMAVSLRDRESGQTMAEYAVVLAVITVAILATLALLAGGIKSALSSVTSKL